MKLLSNQIYLDNKGEKVITQRIYGAMVEYTSPNNHKLWVTKQDTFLREHTYQGHFNMRGWGDDLD